MRKQIEETEHFKAMVKKTPLLRKTYLSPENVRYINELLGQATRLGRDYLNDKQINPRDLKIIDEILKK
jgi:hypothetical protein